MADVLPQSQQPAAFYADPLAENAKPLAKPMAAPKQQASAQEEATEQPKNPFIRLRRKGESVDLDTILFPEDRDLFLQVSIPPDPNSAAAKSNAAQQGQRQGNNASDSNTNSTQNSTNRSESSERSDRTERSESRSENKSDNQSRFDTSSKIEIINRSEPITQPTPQIVYMTPTPPPAPLAALATPGTVQKLFLSAQKLAYARRYDRALSEVDRAIDVEPGNPVLHALKGSIFYRMGEVDNARDAWYKALQYDPTMYDVRESLNRITKPSNRL